MLLTLNEVCEISNTNLEDVLNLYYYGSRVYGTHNEFSDHDFIAVVKNVRPQFLSRDVNITFYTIEEFQFLIDVHEISVLECLFLDKTFVLKECHKFYFKLDLQKLRHSISKKSSNSFVKFKKKLTVEKDFDLNCGRKSLFHSIRIVQFGIQLSKYNCIVDYTGLKNVYNHIFEISNLEYLLKTFKPIHNQVLTEFRKYTIK